MKGLPPCLGVVVGLLASVRASGANWAHYDGNGNVVLLTDGSGAASARYAYDAFGKLKSSSGPAAEANRYRFSTKPQERAAALSYYGYRYYAPSHGRWLSRDPLEEEGGVNLYAMSGNDPISNFDRLGLDWSQSVVDALPNWAVEGLATTPYLPQGLVDGAAGMGDELTFGLTDWLRDQMNTNDKVGKCSKSYSYGKYAGSAVGIAAGGAGAARVGAEIAIAKKGTDVAKWLNQGRYWRVGGTSNTMIPTLRIGQARPPNRFNHIDLRFFNL